MKPQIPWLRVFVEGVVIVGSILLAFGIDAWWDERQERVEEQEALASLEQEFTEFRDGLDRAEDRFRPLDTSLEYALRTLAQGLTEGATSVVLPDTVLSWAFVAPTLQPNLETLNSLISSGRLEIISDRELRSALAGFGRVLEEMTENQIVSQQYVYSELDRVLRARMDISPFRSLRNDINRGAVTPDQLGASSEVPADTEVVGVFATRLATQIVASSKGDPSVSRQRGSSV